MARDSEVMKARYLQGAKNDTVAEINGYNDSEAVNGFKLGGKRMWLTLEERQAVKMALDAYEHNGEKTMTKVWDGVEYTFPIDTYRDMLAKIEQYASECQNVTEKHAMAVGKLETVEEVCDYDYTQGYPEMIDFSSSEEGNGKGDGKGDASTDKGDASNGTSTGASSAEGGGEQDGKDTGADTSKDTGTDKDTGKDTGTDGGDSSNGAG